MALEARAIEFILEREPDWQRMPASNPGFDLLQRGTDGEPSRWCEVKAMTGGLDGRPVGLSRAQFECASELGEAYWLYVVEKAGTSDAGSSASRTQPAKHAHSLSTKAGSASQTVDAEPKDRED